MTSDRRGHVPAIIDPANLKQKNAGRAQFNAVREGVLALLAKGYNRRALYAVLHEKGVFTGSYRRFCEYAQGIGNRERGKGKKEPALTPPENVAPITPVVPFWGEVALQNRPFEECKVYQEHILSVHSLVRMRDNASTFMWDFERMLTRRLTFKEMLQAGDSSIVTRSRILRIGSAQRGGNQQVQASAFLFVVLLPVEVVLPGFRSPGQQGHYSPLSSGMSARGCATDLPCCISATLSSKRSALAGLRSR